MKILLNVWLAFRHHVVLVDLGSILGEDLLRDQGAVLIVGWMDTGLEIAKLETGRISVIVVGNEATLKEIVRIVRRKQLSMHSLSVDLPLCFGIIRLCLLTLQIISCVDMGVVSHVHQVQGGVEVEAVATAGIIVTGLSSSFLLQVLPESHFLPLPNR